MRGRDLLTGFESSLGHPAVVELATLSDLHASAIALIAGRGGGKTTALECFFDVEGGVVAIDPAGELGRRVESRADVLVLDLDESWKEGGRQAFERVAEMVRDKKAKVCISLEDAPYEDVPEIVDAIVDALKRKRVRNFILVGEEAQRYIPQNQAIGYSYRFRWAVEIGRNMGWGVVVASQRYASVDKEVLARCDRMYLGRMQDATDLEAVRKRLARNIRDPALLERTVDEMQFLPAGVFVERAGAIPTVNK